MMDGWYNTRYRYQVPWYQVWYRRRSVPGGTSTGPAKLADQVVVVRSVNSKIAITRHSGQTLALFLSEKID